MCKQNNHLWVDFWLQTSMWNAWNKIECDISKWPSSDSFCLPFSSRVECKLLLFFTSVAKNEAKPARKEASLGIERSIELGRTSWITRQFLCSQIVLWKEPQIRTCIQMDFILSGVVYCTGREEPKWISLYFFKGLIEMDLHLRSEAKQY